MKKITLFVMMLLVPAVVHAAIDVDGTNYVTAVNPLGRTLNQQVGNYSVVQANADMGMTAWDFEGAEFTLGQQLSSIKCHSTLSTPITKRIWFDAVVPYGRIIDGDGAKASSGTKSLTYLSRDSTQTVIRMTDYYGETAIYGVGFILSRMLGNMPISVYDDSNALLYSATVSANGSGFSWFGYQGSTDIAKIVMDTSANEFGNQFWFDDFAVTTTQVPEPITMTLLGCGVLGLIGRKK